MPVTSGEPDLDSPCRKRDCVLPLRKATMVSILSCLKSPQTTLCVETVMYKEHYAW